MSAFSLLTAVIRTRYHTAVRRLAAVLLLLLFSGALIEPVVFADDGSSDLPACCRRGGQHHCAIADAASASGPAVSALCPLYPKVSATPAYGKTAIAPGTWLPVAVPATYAPSFRCGKRPALVSRRGAHAKRGPPSFPVAVVV